MDRSGEAVGSTEIFFYKVLCRLWVVVVHCLLFSMLLPGFTGRARRSWLRALQTSKVSSAPSCFTYPVAVDATTREVLPSALQVRSSGRVLPGWTSQVLALTTSATLPDTPPCLVCPCRASRAPKHSSCLSGPFRYSGSAHSCPL